VKIFLSWSGPQSRAVAEALNDWLPRVIQAVRVFFSPDIEKGAKWSGEMDEALEGTSFGIVCLTPQNLKSEWIHYEAGALSKLREARVWTFLLDLTPGDVGQPLGRFQHTVAERDDVRRLVRTINGQLAAAGATPLVERLLDEIFEDSWPRMEARLQEARVMAVQEEIGAPVIPEVRGERAMLEEMLELLRDQQRRLGDLESRVFTPHEPTESPNNLNDERSLRTAVLQFAVRLAHRTPSLRLQPPGKSGSVRAVALAVLGRGRAIESFADSLGEYFPGGDVIVTLWSTGAAIITLVLQEEQHDSLVDRVIAM
jgi:hypothetical protein